MKCPLGGLDQHKYSEVIRNHEKFFGRDVYRVLISGPKAAVPGVLRVLSGMRSTVWIFAFGFVSPWMLWGLALGAAPIVIHLLYRRRYRETAWAAMQFLTAALRKQSRKMWLEQWLLLAVRTAILLLIALALAGPTLENLSAFSSPPGIAPTHRILVIDASLSMSRREGEQSRFELAREVCRKLLRSARQGDVWNLVRIGGVSPAAVIRRPTAQAEAVLRELEQMECLEEASDLAAAMKDVAELLRATAEPSRKEVLILTDLQTTTWAPSDAAVLSRVHQRLQEISNLAAVSVLTVGSGDGLANSAVSMLETQGGLQRTTQPVPLRIGVRRFGEQTTETMEFSVDGRLNESRPVDLAPGTETVLDRSAGLPAGQHRLEVRLNADSLPADDRRRAVVAVSDRLPVLLVNGKPSGQPWENSTDLLKLALAPEESSPFIPTVIPESEMLSTRLADYACVFLCNLALITDREAGWLRDYLDQGGAVVFCMGSQVRLDQYNQTLFAGERPLLPARLLEVVGDPKSTNTAFEFDPGDFSHPIIKPFQGNPNSGLELTRTFAYVKTDVPPERETEVALRFQTGDPAILTAAAGRGRVVLITTSVDREWSTWAVWGHSFIPLMHELVQYAIAHRRQERQLVVGEPLTAIAPDESVRSAELVLPDQETVVLDVTDRQVAFEQTLRSGFYELRWGAPVNRSDWYAVNVDLAESDLAALDESSLRQTYSVTADWTISTTEGRSPPTASASESGRLADVSTAKSTQPWSRPLLLAAFWLLLVEQGLAWKFSVGMTALSVGVLVLAAQWVSDSALSVWGLAILPAVATIAVAGLWFQQRRRMKLR